MGICQEVRADKTKFIIDEDYKVKRAMIDNLQKYEDAQNPKEAKEDKEKTRDSLPKNTKQDNLDKIISKNNLKLLDVYQILSPLGEGGYGKVFSPSSKNENT